MTRPEHACKAKRVWYSRATAQVVADFESDHKALTGTDRLYVYQCPVCSGYHLTKIPQGDNDE